MKSKGVRNETGEDFDELGRILISFHNEIENPDEGTNTIFKNHTSLYTTQGMHLNMTEPPDVDGFGTENITRTDDFIDEASGLEFKFIANGIEDVSPLTPDGNSGYLY